MHPYYSPHHMGMGMWRRGPSRIVWFAIGAITASWWIHRKETDRRIFGHCKRPQLQSPLPIPPIDDPITPSGAPWPDVRSIPNTISNIPSGWDRRQLWQWEQEKEHMATISQQATDAMADLTESTLESVLNTAEALKAKLAEHRAEREKQQKMIEKRLEEERKNPPRLI
ncbi:hypothetical protein B0H34DRAFT_858436 [Crassisporium funariophilum]|nr:hypothetical protein B0H34DRAFT_858436 [Crassisporium funariophilum]